MTIRYYQTSSRVVVSKPGFDASDSGLADANKLFDSAWDFSGVLIASGTVVDPSSPASGEPFFTSSTSPIIINFPDPGYVPAAYVFCEHTVSQYGFPDVGFSGFKHTFPVGRTAWDLAGEASFIYSDRIEIRRSRTQDGSGSGLKARYPGVIRYMVFGVSQ
ncbi:hypothetical protein [Rhizobium phage RHph_X2_26]|nr:hypothetical protein [Rhizobium phage RHph_X2_26]